jgi:hypothetical protein
MASTRPAAATPAPRIPHAAQQRGMGVSGDRQLDSPSSTLKEEKQKAPNAPADRLASRQRTSPYRQALRDQSSLNYLPKYTFKQTALPFLGEGQ